MRNLINIRIPCPCNELADEHLWWIKTNSNDQIISVNPMPSDVSFAAEDWSGDWLSPRGVDLQINGGLGLTFTELKLDQLPTLIKLLDRLWIDGIGAIAPTLVSCSVAALRQSLEVLHRARKHTSHNRCKLLGAHLEGPFLAQSFKGAHNSKHLCLPSLLALNERIKGYEKEISLVTLAPELPGSMEVINKLKESGIIISLGHSAADCKVSNAAFNSGISMITHTFNAMPGMHHRAPGPIAEAISRGDIALGLIADGIHVHSQLAVILQQLASENLFLVSDALPPYALYEKEFKWDQRLLHIDQGVCRLDDGTLAGTTLPLLEGCKRLSIWTGQPSSAIWAATLSPRLALEKGKMIKEFFLGEPLNELLRWNLNSGPNLLNWIPAG